MFRTLSLIIEVEVNGEKQYTTAKDDVLVNSDSPTMWNEHLFFEMKNLVSQLLAVSNRLNGQYYLD